MNQIGSTLLRRLAELDPAAEKRSTDPVTVERTRQWVLGHDRLSDERVERETPAPGVAAIGAMLEPEPARARARPPRGPMRRRVVLVGAGVALVLGVVGVLPSVLPDGGTTPPAAAIPMLDYSQPGGVDGVTHLLQLADHLRGSEAMDESGRYFFEHRRYVGYSMHEVEVSEGQWLVDRLELREDDSYYWVDTTDLSGGRLDVSEGEMRAEFALGAGESPDALEVPESSRALFDLLLWDPQQQEHPGHHLMDEYNARANQLSIQERAVFLEALALADDITSYGSVTDRLGREGVAFGASRVEDDDGEAVTIETVVILDPRTGGVLERDTIYPNDLPGAPDVVEEYELVVDSRYSDTLPPCGTRPCPGASANDG